MAKILRNKMADDSRKAPRAKQAIQVEPEAPRKTKTKKSASNDSAIYRFDYTDDTRRKWKYAPVDAKGNQMEQNVAPLGTQYLDKDVFADPPPTIWLVFHTTDPSK